MIRIFVDPWRKNTRPRRFSMHKETTRLVTVDFSKAVAERSTSVSSVAWSSEGTQNITITNESLSSNVASADVSSDWSGFGIIKIQATYADGAKETIYAEVRVYSPEDE